MMTIGEKPMFSLSSRSAAPVAAMAVIAATASYGAEIISPTGHGATIEIGGAIPAYLALDLLQAPMPITPLQHHHAYRRTVDPPGQHTVASHRDAYTGPRRRHLAGPMQPRRIMAAGHGSGGATAYL